MSSFIDEEQAIQIYYDLDSQRRKDLVNTLGEILQREPKYLGTPTFNYEVGDYLITRTGTIICPKNCTREMAEQIISMLKEHGFDHTRSNLTQLVISLPKSMVDDASIDRLRNLVKSKETILKAALRAEELKIQTTDEKINFPWFTLTGAEGETEAYSMLITALGKVAREQKRISAHEKPQDNLKYAMRLFLVRLGFIGDEYKQARKILLRDLSGNCSWKAGHAPERRDMAEETSEPDTLLIEPGSPIKALPEHIPVMQGGDT